MIPHLHLPRSSATGDDFTAGACRPNRATPFPPALSLAAASVVSPSCHSILSTPCADRWLQRQKHPRARMSVVLGVPCRGKPNTTDSDPVGLTIFALRWFWVKYVKRFSCFYYHKIWFVCSVWHLCYHFYHCGKHHHHHPYQHHPRWQTV